MFSTYLSTFLHGVYSVCMLLHSHLFGLTKESWENRACLQTYVNFNVIVFGKRPTLRKTMISDLGSNYCTCTQIERNTNLECVYFRNGTS